MSPATDVSQTDINLTNAAGYYLYPNEANAWKNSALSAAATAELLNANLDVIYHGQWAQWASYIQQGITPPNAVPQPPMAWTTAVQPDGYTRAVPGTVPLCAIPPTPPGPRVIPLPVLGLVAVGIAVAGNPPWFTVVPGDGLTDGQTTPPNTKSVDGVTGTFRKRVIPWGSLYEKVG